MSAEELRAAMKSAEDETDAAAATAAEQETAEELAEFTADHAPAGDHDDEDARDKYDWFYNLIVSSVIVRKAFIVCWGCLSGNC